MLTEIVQQMGFATAEKPPVGLSACLAGQPVRYDGTDKRDDRLMEQLTQVLDFQPLCPEVSAGMGVPRAPIQVVQVAQQLRVRGVADPGQDMSEALAAVADQVPAGLYGFVLKARSPSCGVDNTPVHDVHGQPIGVDSGAFSRRLRARFALMPLISEADLCSAEALAVFALQVYSYRCWQQQQAAVLADLPGVSAGLPEAIRGPLLGYLNRLGEQR